jgi:hypothetical protein
MFGRDNNSEDSAKRIVYQPIDFIVGLRCESKLPTENTD